MSQSDLPNAPLPVSRRGILSTLAVAAAASFSGTSGASAWSLFKRHASMDERIDTSGMSSEWVRHQGSDLDAYAAFLSSIGLRNLTARQVIESHAKKHGPVWNTLPPRSMWDNMVPTLKVIDRIGLELGQPVTEIISAYRCPAYNARCAGAASGSWHKKNYAIDVVFPARPSVVAATARRLRGEGVFQGGVGRYATFTHVDTRGQSVDW
ncbi:YcbK family protein [Haloferula sargassicola]|uniref:Peptidase M15A C-terminal domain-containing protein n=1 Tax=Haloferula sargassicola TaxID=490096 RepID=A0ABP9ULQ3_9BACT